MPYTNPEDQKAAARRWYQDNKEITKQRAKVFTKKARVRNAKFLKEYKEVHPCVDCGEKDWFILEFDHPNDNKRANVSDMRGLSITTIKDEIAKCDVVCPNCHKRRTYSRNGTHDGQ